MPRKIKQPELKEVYVFNGMVVWNGSACTFPFEQYVCVSDGLKVINSQWGLEHLVNSLKSGIGLSAKISETTKFIYAPPAPSNIVYMGGHFGREPMPARVWVYDQLKDNQIQELNLYLSK